MATKDWKKIKTNLWEKNNKKYLRVSITKENEYDGNYYQVHVPVTKKTSTWHSFQTKKQALAYAKAYMRKH